MSDAVLGFVGVLVGAVSSIGTTWFVDGRRTRREREAQVLDDERHSQVAARVVLSDLVVAEGRLKVALRKDRNWSPRFELPRESWTLHRDTLALHLPFDDWEVVSTAADRIRRVEAQAESARLNTGEEKPSLTKFRQGQIQFALRRIEPAVTALTRFCGISTPVVDEEDEDETVDPNDQDAV